MDVAVFMEDTSEDDIDIVTLLSKLQKPIKYLAKVVLLSGIHLCGFVAL